MLDMVDHIEHMLDVVDQIEHGLTRTRKHRKVQTKSKDEAAVLAALSLDFGCSCGWVRDTLVFVGVCGWVWV